jgi:uncharacterized protein
MSRYVAFVVLICLGMTAAHALDPRGIASPRPASWIVDRANLISAESEAEINRRIDAVKRATRGEIAVVTLPSIGGGDHRHFATKLFNHWGVGDAAADNGVLLLVAIEDRAAELILGDGIDSPEQIRQAKGIMDEDIVPRMRRGDPEGAIRAGVESVIRRFFPSTPGQAMTAARLIAPSETTHPPAREDTGNTIAAVVGGGSVSLVLIAFARSRLRHRTRKCPHCGAPMILLNERADDAHLLPSEQTEEKLGSVDYDVWLCNRCNHVLKLRYRAFYTQYARCPQCNALTKHTKTTTEIWPTEVSQGLARIDEHCKHCGYACSYTRVLPPLPRSDDSNDFGGGSSSGAGASGRW